MFRVIGIAVAVLIIWNINQIVQYVFNHPEGALVALFILLLTIYQSWSDKKRQKKAETLMPRLKDQHKNDFVFFCKFADDIDDSDEDELDWFMMEGESNNTITTNTKIIDPIGKEHKILEIFIDKDDIGAPVAEVAAGINFTLRVSGTFDLKDISKRISNEAVVVLNLK